MALTKSHITDAIAEKTETKRERKIFRKVYEGISLEVNLITCKK